MEMLESRKMVKRKAKRKVHNSDKVSFFLGPKSAKKAIGRRKATGKQQVGDRQPTGKRQASHKNATRERQGNTLSDREATRR